MSKKMFTLGVVFGLSLVAAGCGGGHLVSIQALPVDPTILNNNTVYATPGGVVQYEIQAFYSNNTAASIIPSSQGRWSSTATGIATVDSNGLVTSVGPVGTATITVTYGGQKSTTIFGVCTLSSLCPPTCDPSSCP